MDKIVPAPASIVELVTKAKEKRRAKIAGNGEVPHGQTSGFRMTTDGLLWSEPSLTDDEKEKSDVLVSGYFEIVAENRDDTGNCWGIILRWKDRDGRSHDWAMPHSLLAGDGLEVRRALLDGGLYVGAGGRARNLLTNYLTLARAAKRARAVSSTGWVGSTFVFPDCAIGATHLDEHVILQTPHFIDHAYNVHGTLEEWQENIARYAVGNSRLVLAISTAFAAALIGPCGAESGGIHLRGKSSVGKTTALGVAGSVWGGSDKPSGFIRAWRATANGLEGTAVIHNDALLCLDEISQVSSREAGEVAYMLANGKGKGRASRDATLRKVAQWRLLFLSTGEISLADKIAEDMRGRRQTAGQQVRVVDLPSAEGKHGLFDDLHGFESASEFADHLRGACGKYYGVACRKFIEAIAPELDDAASSVKDEAQRFVDYNCPGDRFDGQVKRVASRFGLIAASGEIATMFGILPWPEGEAIDAASECFAAWIKERGGAGAAEEKEGVEAVRSFLSANAFSRFFPAWEPFDPVAAKIISLAGYKRRVHGDADAWDFFVTADAWMEVAAGFNKKSLAGTLAKKGLLVTSDPGHLTNRMRIPSITGAQRFYHISHKILGDEDD